MFSVPRPRKLGAIFVCTATALWVAGVCRPSAHTEPVPRGGHDVSALAPAFVPNAGEADSAALFVSVGGGRPIFFTTADVRMLDPRHERSLWLTFVDADALRVEGASPTGGYVTSFHGRGQPNNSGSRMAYGDIV